MKKLLFVACVLCLLSYGNYSNADIACTNGTNAQPIPYTNETLTVSNTSVGLTASKYNGSDGGGNAVEVLISTEGSIRAFFDGTAPTAAVGVPFVGTAAAPVYFTVCSVTIPKLRMIRQSADSTVTVQYSR